jgi:hypothetical protein
MFGKFEHHYGITLSKVCSLMLCMWTWTGFISLGQDPVADCFEHISCSGCVKGWKFLLIDDITLWHMNSRKEADCQPQLNSLSCLLLATWCLFQKAKHIASNKNWWSVISFCWKFVYKLRDCWLLFGVSFELQSRNWNCWKCKLNFRREMHVHFVPGVTVN